MKTLLFSGAVSLISACGEAPRHEFSNLKDARDFSTAKLIDVELYPSNLDRPDGLEYARRNRQNTYFRVPGDFLRRYYANYPIGQGDALLESSTVRMVGYVSDGELLSFSATGDFGKCAYLSLIHISEPTRPY